MTRPLLEVASLQKRFTLRSGDVLHALDGIDLTVNKGEVVGLVGESGCGKTTLGKTLVGLHRPDNGLIRFDGREIQGLPRSAMREVRSRVQYVYQDAGAALDPRQSIGRSLEEPLAIHTRQSKVERHARVRGVLQAVGLREEHLELFPHEVSGGQQRRVGLARALTLNPDLLILDEPTSGLDVSVQATILKLLHSVWQEFGLTLLFVSHDLAVVRSICTRVAVMYLGKIVEVGETAEVFDNPRHPYTLSLLAAVPSPGGRRVIENAWLEGEPPNPVAIPSGCRFRPRCPKVQPRCAVKSPPLLTTDTGRSAVACHYA